MRRLLAATIAATLAATFALAGCSPSTPEVTASGGVGGINDLIVSASDTRAPAIEWPAQLTFPKAESAIVWSGDGAMLVDGQPLLLDVYIQSLETGEVLKNTYDGLPISKLLAPELLGQDLYNSLINQRVGARVLSIAPSSGTFEAETAIAIVIDVLSPRAEGTSVNNRDDLPIVINSATGEPDVALRETKELPTDLTVSTLIRGDGEQIEEGSYIVAQYKAVYAEGGSDETTTWLPGAVFASTWETAHEPYYVQIGVGETLRALDEGLIDQTAGSQVLIVAPEMWGYPGKGTMVFVIDILDVWTPDS